MENFWINLGVFYILRDLSTCQGQETMLFYNIMTMITENNSSVRREQTGADAKQEEFLCEQPL